MARASRYFLLGEGHLMRATLQFQIVNVYCSTSKGTKAMTRGHGGNCLHCLLEVSGLMKTIFVKSAILLWHSICGSRVRPCPLRSNTGTQGVQLSVSFTHPSPPFSLWNTPHGKVVPMTRLAGQTPVARIGLECTIFHRGYINSHTGHH